MPNPFCLRVYIHLGKNQTNEPKHMTTYQLLLLAGLAITIFAIGRVSTKL